MKLTIVPINPEFSVNITIILNNAAINAKLNTFLAPLYDSSIISPNDNLVEIERTIIAHAIVGISEL